MVAVFAAVCTIHTSLPLSQLGLIVPVVPVCESSRRAMECHRHRSVGLALVADHIEVTKASGCIPTKANNIVHKRI